MTWVSVCENEINIHTEVDIERFMDEGNVPL